MITFQEFQYNCNLILERYYAPDEKLPSGNTPVKKAEDKLKKLSRKRKNAEKIKDRKERLSTAIEKNVKHGADNPNVNPHQSDNKDDDFVYQSDDKRNTHIQHPSNGIRYTIRRVADVNGKPHHRISWYSAHDSEKMTPEEARKHAYAAKQMYHKSVEHRLPSNSIVSNSPANRKLERIYQAHGFGKEDKWNNQYATVGRPLSPKQKANRRRPTRLAPMKSPGKIL